MVIVCDRPRTLPFPAPTTNSPGMSATNQNIFPVYTIETAPVGSKPTLERLRQAVGLIPNLAGAMAGSPAMIEGFVTLRGIFQSGTFSPTEREVISLTNAVENGCQYCRAIHSTFALQCGLPEIDVDAIRRGAEPADPKLRALTGFARQVLRQRGQADPSAVTQFLAAGYQPAQALEVVLGLAVSVLANYGNHLVHAPLDDFLRPQA